MPNAERDVVRGAGINKKILDHASLMMQLDASDSRGQADSLESIFKGITMPDNCL